MHQASPFVVAVASEKGGVGKTTIATNLAVYLKALREDLPVTIASFDNHFSVDNMFAIGSHRGSSVAGLFDGVPAADLAQLGQYGVQFLSSESRLLPPDDGPGRLGRALAASNLPGILILDTRPILDYFTRSALQAADLVLLPVKDRPSLVNAASVQSALRQSGEDGEEDRLWLVPSLIDARLRLRPGLGMRDFLVFCAGERGYQVVETFIAKSPKVEGLATGFSSRVFPVLTHARSTAVHGQFRDLATFVLERFDAASRPRCARLAPVAGGVAEVPPGRLRRLLRECPICAEAATGSEGYAFQDLGSRRRGFMHGECLRELLRETVGDDLDLTDGMLALGMAGAGLVGAEGEATLSLFDGQGGELSTVRLTEEERVPFEALWRFVSGRPVEELYREVLIVCLAEGAPFRFLTAGGHEHFARLRRRVMREVLPRIG